VQLPTQLIFTYETGAHSEIVEPLPNVTVSNGTNSTAVTVTAVHAGKVTVALKESPEFDRYDLCIQF